MQHHGTLTALLVEDSTIVREYIAAFLRRLNFQVITANNGLRALEMLAHHAVDLIVTDLNMPGMDGLMLIDRLRSHKRFQKVPILVMTSVNNAHIKKVCCQKAITGFITKPFSQEQLGQEIKRLVEARS